MKEKKKIIFSGIIIVAVIAIAVLGLLLIQTNNKLNKVNNDFSKVQKEMTNVKNELAEKEKEIEQIKRQNTKNSASIEKYKKSLLKKNKTIKQQKKQIEQLKEKAEEANKTATVGEYTDGKGSEGIHVKITSASSSSISFEYSLIYSNATYIAGFNASGVSLLDGKGSFSYDNGDEAGTGTIEVIDSKTIKFQVTCRRDETVRGYTSGCDMTTLYLD